MKQGKVILIEGYDFTGKTSVCNHLVEEYDGYYFHNPEGKTDLTRTTYNLIKDNKNMDETTKLLLILSTFSENINYINKMKHDGKTIIVDRGILSVYCYQFINFESFTNLMSIIDMPKMEVDEVFVLTASIEALKDRMQKRGEDNLDSYFFTNIEKIMTKYHEHYADFYPKAHKISTTTKTEKETIKRVSAILRKVL